MILDLYKSIGTVVFGSADTLIVFVLLHGHIPGAAPGPGVNYEHMDKRQENFEKIPDKIGESHSVLDCDPYKLRDIPENLDGAHEHLNGSLVFLEGSYLSLERNQVFLDAPYAKLEGNLCQLKAAIVSLEADTDKLNVG